LCALAALVAAQWGLAGCARNILSVDRLPARFEAPRVTNVQQLDLSRLAGATVSSELIERGDVLQVTIGSGVSNDEMLTVPLRVAEDGTANVPIVGGVPVAGLELEGSEQAIRAAAITRNVYRNPQVTVTLKQKRINRVTVVGAVKKPGVYDVSRSSSHLLAALVAAGGLSEDASNDVEIRRGRPATATGGPYDPTAGSDRVAGTPAQLAGYPGQPVPPASAQLIPTANVHIDLAAAAMQGDSGVPVGDGDVVMVIKRVPKPVHVIGLVSKPGQYELPANQQMRMLDAVAMAGGLSSQVADKVYVIRQVPNEPEPVVIQVSIQDAKTNGRENLALAPGDVVSIEQTPATVMLEALKNFVRFGASAAVPIF
jgi:polysaccharide export outer membrane protein